MYAFGFPLKEESLCDWPHKARCKSGGGDVKPTDLPTVRPTPPPTQPTLPPASSTEGTLSSSGEVVSSTTSRPTVEPTRPPQGGTLSGNCVHVFIASAVIVKIFFPICHFKSEQMPCNAAAT